MLDKIKELDVLMVVADLTSNDELIARDLGRADRSQIPVNLIYPPNYPEQPAILLEELITPDDALHALERMVVASNMQLPPDKSTEENGKGGSNLTSVKLHERK